ncbi:MAG: hypothetical protein M0033_02580 [Nitrospiraceae bacterium]|nr:hypothetical protein [Nitrospiraceae bacterium]MDA8325084.1 hypothetical protein [Nitrospiraceae bacterium]
MTKNERKELEKLEELELKKLALELELPVVKNRAELIESILRKGQKRIVPSEKSPGGGKKKG